MTALAERIHLDLSFVSRKAQVLEQYGLVRRSPDPEEGRVAIMTLTSLGEEAVARLSAAWGGVLATLLADWNSGEVAAFQQFSRGTPTRCSPTPCSTSLR